MTYGWALYLRCRGTALVLAGSTAVSGLVVLVVALGVQWRLGNGFELPVAVILPLAASCLIIITVDSPYAANEDLAVRSMYIMRLAVLTTTIFIAGVLVWLGALGLTAGPLGSLATLRNMLFLTGVGLLAARLVGGIIGTVAPIAFTGVCVTLLAEGAYPPTTFNVLLQPSDEHLSLIIAVFACILGIAVCSFRRRSRNSIRS